MDKVEMAATFHAAQCSWHCDQYEHECDCGVSRPATIMWAQAEESAAREAVFRANERLAVAQARLRDMTAQAIDTPETEGQSSQGEGRR